MITEKETSEYKTLCATCRDFHEKYLRRKRELRQLLEETAALRKDALLVLKKANRLTRHLTGYQRQISGLSYQLGEIEARINQGREVLFKGPGVFEDREILPEIREECCSRLELKQRGLLLLRMIDSIRKKILQLDLLELRCRELILAIKKALEAFRHEWANIRRKIYPFGIFSLFCRKLRFLWGRTYFSLRDMNDLAALGSITGCFLKIADSPIV